MTKTQAKKELEALIKKFEALSEHEKKEYNEANTCKNFILPLFRILGWDVSGDEVVSELKASGGRVDYSFSLNGLKRFFVEAKAIKVDLDQKQWAEQAIDYAWHKSVPWAVLSDFEGLKIFSAQWEEMNPEMCLFKDLHYKDYLEKFDDLWLLSRESIEKGELDKLALETGRSPKRAVIDKQLTTDLLAWHDFLLKEFWYEPKNKKMGRDKFEECLQKLLNRLIFIRTMEDRGIEDRDLQSLLREYEQLHRKNDYLITGLKKIFAKFEKDYDSKLFEKHIIDTDKFEIVEYALAEIIGYMYLTKKGARYNFALIPADVLGSIYEQYLGNIQREGEDIDAKSKRKSQGIYYTPRYIVDYIVKNTVGEYLKDKSLNEALKIKILDPACGSGSFLLRAFEELDSYLEREKNQIKKDDAQDYLRKIQILSSNIYGVDLDEEAVELTRLNLLLKTAIRKFKLPLLNDTIKCGNSLISGSEAELKKYFGKDWEKKKPFNWEEEFDKGKFDVIIGNPPYGVAFNKDERAYFLNQYKYNDKDINSFILFIERSLGLLNDGGYLGFIVPKNIIKTDDYENIRRYIFENYSIISITDCGKSFEGVTGEMVILIFKKLANKLNQTEILTIEDGKTINKCAIAQNEFGKLEKFRFNILLTKKAVNLIKIIKKGSLRLEELVKIFRGIETGKKDEYIKNQKPKGPYKKIIAGKDLDRYMIRNIRFIDYIPEKINFKNEKMYNQPKILVRKISDSICATFDEDNLYTTQGVYIFNNQDRQQLKYILGIINSKLIHWYYETIFNMGSHLTTNVTIENLKNLPIRIGEKEKKSELIKLVDKILEINKELQKIDPIMDKEKYEKKKKELEETDGEIDKLVYKLYGLGEEEIKIVEGR